MAPTNEHMHVRSPRSSVSQRRNALLAEHTQPPWSASYLHLTRHSGAICGPGMTLSQKEDALSCRTLRPHLWRQRCRRLPVDGLPKRHLPGGGVFSAMTSLCLWQPLRTIAQAFTGASVNTSVQELALKYMQSLPGSVDSALPWEKSSLWSSLPETLYLHNSPLPTQVLPISLVITGSGWAQGLFVATWRPFPSAIESPQYKCPFPYLPLLLSRPSSSVSFLLG